jgi:hypothetical protein
VQELHGNHEDWLGRGNHEDWLGRGMVSDTMHIPITNQTLSREPTRGLLGLRSSQAGGPPVAQGPVLPQRLEGKVHFLA